MGGRAWRQAGRSRGTRGRNGVLLHEARGTPDRFIGGPSRTALPASAGESRRRVPEADRPGPARLMVTRPFVREMSKRPTLTAEDAPPPSALSPPQVERGKGKRAPHFCP